MNGIAEVLLGIIFAVFVAVAFISIGMSTNTFLSGAFIWGGILGLLAVFLVILGIASKVSV